MQFTYIYLYTYQGYILQIDHDDLVDKTLTEKSVDVYWTSNLIVIGVLMGIGFLVTFVVPFFGRSLFLNATWHNLPFLLGAQGVIVIYVLLIIVYAIVMNRLDRRQRQARRINRRVYQKSIINSEKPN